MCKCNGYFQFALVGLVASAVAAPSGILAGGYGGQIVKSYTLADSVPAAANGLQVKKGYSNFIYLSIIVTFWNETKNFS